MPQLKWHDEGFQWLLLLVPLLIISACGPHVTVHKINWEARLNKTTFLAFIMEYKATIQIKTLLVQLRRMKSRTWCLMTTMMTRRMMRRTMKRSPLLNRQRRSRRSRQRGGLQKFWQNTDFFFVPGKHILQDEFFFLTSRRMLLGCSIVTDCVLVSFSLVSECVSSVETICCTVSYKVLPCLFSLYMRQSQHGGECFLYHQQNQVLFEDASLVRVKIVCVDACLSHGIKCFWINLCHLSASWSPHIICCCNNRCLHCHLFHNHNCEDFVLI